ncbi:MAG: DUF2330 domain-containing protein [Myxococcota bacterium]
MWIALLLLSPDALACGGFFCNTTPVAQTGEDVLFVVDEARGETTVHVKITYAGEAPDFAWIVPVAGIPELRLSTAAVFPALTAAAGPSVRTVVPWEAGSCDMSNWERPSTNGDYLSPPAPQVVSQDELGPYETVVLRAQSTAELTDWLRVSGYDLPPSLDAVLAPYVAEGSYFVALKLASGASVGDLQPLAVRYAGTGMSIPIRLTALAATPDLPVRVAVLAQARAVPDSYLHATLDPLRLDWWSQLTTWTYVGGATASFASVLGQAIDEASGHAFVTHYSGRAGVMSGRVWSAGAPDIDALAAAQTPLEARDVLQSMGVSADAPLASIWATYLPMPESLALEGVTPQMFYGCFECFEAEVAAIPFDAPAFAAAVDERIVTPRQQLQEAFDTLPWLTTLETQLSPEEMTVDPTFALNPDLPQEVELGPAVWQHLCADDRRDFSWMHAPTRIDLPDGRSYDLPSEAWLSEHDTTASGLLETLPQRSVSTVEDLGADGPGVVLIDHRALQLEEMAWWNDTHPWREPQAPTSTPSVTAEPAPVSGCDSGAPTGALGLGVALLALRRRRG